MSDRGLRGHTRSTLALALTTLVAATALADSPPAAPADLEVFSRNRHFYVLLDHVANRTTAFRVRPGAEPEKLWEMPGWFPVVALSDDGEYLVVGQPGNNLIDLDHAPDVVILSFFRRGVLTREVRLPELVPDASALQRTMSHYEWGSHLGFDDQGHYRVQTADGRVVAFDVATGERVSADRRGDE
jgi:hypothetical protein